MLQTSSAKSYGTRRANAGAAFFNHSCITLPSWNCTVDAVNGAFGRRHSPPEFLVVHLADVSFPGVVRFLVQEPMREFGARRALGTPRTVPGARTQRVGPKMARLTSQRSRLAA